LRLSKRTTASDFWFTSGFIIVPKCVSIGLMTN
jgi:hypothetical protein